MTMAMPKDPGNREILIASLKSVALWAAVFIPLGIVLLALQCIGVPSPWRSGIGGGVCGAGSVLLRRRIGRNPRP